MHTATLSIWSVYDHPDDFPESYIAKRFELHAGEVYSTNDFMIHHDLGLLRHRLERCGLFCIPRYDDDDPKIVETWV
jgi:hypothetical protein